MRNISKAVFEILCTRCGRRGENGERLAEPTGMAENSERGERGAPLSRFCCFYMVSAFMPATRCSSR